MKLTDVEVVSYHRKRSKRGLYLWLIGLGVFLVVEAVGAVAAYRIPQQTPVTPIDPLEQAVRRGPDSYFHHFFDPDKRFGMVGQIDLDLDNFDRATTHGLLFAAISSTPPNIPEFTIKTAEVWAPGVTGADNGLIVFVFPAARRIRVEVGYGLEAALTDVTVRRLIEAHFVPGLRDGDYLAAVEAIVPPLLERMRTVPPAKSRTRTGLLSDIAVAAKVIPRKARLVRTAWLENPPRLRMVLSTVGAALLTLFAVLLGSVVQCVARLVRRFVVRSNAHLRVQATLDLTNSLLRLLQIAFILFAIVVGTSFFFPGTGTFGGAGVDVSY